MKTAEVTPALARNLYARRLAAGYQVCSLRCDPRPANAEPSLRLSGQGLSGESIALFRRGSKSDRRLSLGLQDLGISAFGVCAI
jgi:hypothetical protein